MTLYRVSAIPDEKPNTTIHAVVIATDMVEAMKMLGFPHVLCVEIRAICGGIHADAQIVYQHRTEHK